MYICHLILISAQEPLQILTRTSIQPLTTVNKTLVLSTETHNSFATSLVTTVKSHSLNVSNNSLQPHQSEHDFISKTVSNFHSSLLSFAHTILEQNLPSAQGIANNCGFISVIQEQVFAKLYFYGCVHICIHFVWFVCGICMRHMSQSVCTCMCTHPKHKGTQSSTLNSSTVVLSFISQRRGLIVYQLTGVSLSLSVKLISQKFQGSSFLCPPTMGLQSHTAIPRFLYGCWRYNLRSLCFYLRLS